MEMTKLLLRAARKSDFARIREIALAGWLFSYKHIPEKDIKRLVNEYYSERNLIHSLKNARRGTDYFVVAELHGKVIGYGHVTRKGVLGELLKLYLDTWYIGKGVGKKMLMTCEWFLKSRDCRSYFTFVNTHNKLGTNFYIRNGFVHVTEKDEEEEFKEGKVLWCMEKKL